MSSDLSRERSGVSFPVEELTQFIFGGPEETKKKRWLLSLLDVNKNPVFKNEDRNFISRDKHYVRTLEKLRKLIQYKKQYNIEREDWIFLLLSTGESLQAIMHDFLFIPTLEGQMSQEQLEKWLPLAKDYAIFGCYAQTELGHGSNIRRLETTATYIHETDEFDIHSPTLTSTKWWPGAIARTSTHAALFARLIIDGKDYGVHPFLVQLRGENHKPLPGIDIGDVGPKYGYNNIDNGFVRFTHVRIPRDQMLMKFSKVSRDGTYSTPPYTKAAYGTLVAGRADIIEQTSFYLAKVLCIAIRYSIIRKQGNDTKNNPNELTVLDYQYLQHRLFYGLSIIYTFTFIGRWMRDLYEINKKKVEEGDISLMADVHAISSGLKSLCTNLVMESMNDTLFACGGHGYSHFSGIPSVVETCAQNPIVEGDNTILYLQTGRYLIKAFENAKNGRSTPATLSYLKDYSRILSERSQATTWEELTDPNEQIKALTHHHTQLLAKLISNLEKSSRTHPQGYEGAKSDYMIDIINVSRAFSYKIIITSANEGLESIKSTYPNIYPILRILINLFYSNTIIKYSGEFLLDNYFNSKHIEIFEFGIKNCLKKIRPDAIGLVDAWEFSDNVLNSAIGRYDGNVYETLYNWAKLDPLNLAQERGEYVGYNEVMKSIYNGDYLKGINKSKL
ncbi:peroxisomal acyl-coenzyme A oxidase 1 [Glomus cerebriforme]|uniref:Acyl-coenzyme A oxidase n=1 Tax=Glomus cerebriforme TaxID=658196 RepID=A0A397TFS5_9GLOM|nr:peroxisomal acyl-coenzyme A oxidase 1 [Glomus cerebriforme]